MATWGGFWPGDRTATTQGLGALTVHSMGRFGTFTGATNLDSLINGKLLSLKSKADVKDIFLDVQGQIGSLTIGGSLLGGVASNSAVISSTGDIGAVIITGDLIGEGTSGAFFDNGAIRVANDIGSATIKGSIIGNTTNRALITARGQLTPAGTTDLAIGKLTVTGRVEHALIHAGESYPVFTPSVQNADAQIGPVIVGGDWIASDLVAGALAGGDGQFGNADDVIMSGAGVKNVATVFSKITSIVIGGQVLGTVGAGDHFGFVAQNIGSFKVKNSVTTFPLLAGNTNDDFLVGLLGDLRVNEI